MKSWKAVEKDPWHYIPKLLRIRLTLSQIGANLAGASIVMSYFVFIDESGSFQHAANTLTVGSIMFFGLVVIAVTLHRIFQKDLTDFMRLKAKGQEVASELNKRVQRKILNLPSISALISSLNWVLAAFVMSTYNIFELVGESPAVILFEGSRVFVGIIISGVVVCAIIFFTTEIFCRRIYPYFFPHGGLIKIRGAYRLKLRTRMIATFALASFLPMILMAVLSYNKARLMLIMNPEDVIQSLFYLTAFLLAAALIAAMILSRLSSTGILTPISQMEQAMRKVEQGDLSASVPVSSNDELGVLAENFNQMTEGLRERYHMRQSLDLAMEVQQRLLPKGNLKRKGFDIAGRSIYCDETGGDYFDFIINGRGENERIGIAIGDVSGHGIPSALLMATVRSSLRQRTSFSGSAANIINDVNRQLVLDVEDSGQFVTMFYLSIDPTQKQLQWVRAGHDAAIFYDPGTKSFEELGGSGIALGVDKNWNFKEGSKTDLCHGQIILLSTDGIWEARNPNGDMFGKDPIYDILHSKAAMSANEILEAILRSLSIFQNGTKIEDDITLVVVKISD
ncbi:MAG: SpoIIE family protein phosphatase [Deltaproteobacteria bacterium]|nr:MAG: SpoIIE family protein phosphatase [Deltaproteobacteria bacterium]